MEHAVNKAILIVLETLFASLVLMLVFSAYHGLSDIYKSKDRQVERTRVEQKYEDIQMYNGSTMKGEEVLALIDKYRNYDICINVEGTPYNYNSENLTESEHQEDQEFKRLVSEAKTYGSANYIDPLALYRCRAFEDNGTKAILRLDFTKEA